MLFDHLSHSIVKASQIKSWTEKDPVLARIHYFLLHGWPDTPPSPAFRPYFNRREELTANEWLYSVWSQSCDPSSWKTVSHCTIA